MARVMTRVIAALLVVVSVVGIATRRHPADTAVATIAGCVVDTTDVLGWWRGEDDLLAEIGPTLGGTVGFDGGYVGQGMSFDATSTASVANLQPVGDGVSVEMWVKPSVLATPGGQETLASRWDFPSTDDSARSFALFFEPNGSLFWTTDDISTRRPEELVGPAPQLLDGGFHHVAATWDRTTMVLYVDGTQVAAKASQGGTLNPAPSTTFRLGSKSGPGDPFQFNGIIDEPTVWSRALSAAEVGSIAAAGNAGKCTFIPSEKAKLTSSFPGIIDRFGSSIDVQGHTIVVGAPYSSRATQFAGAVSVYFLTGATWSPQATLVAGDPHVVDLFGSSVAVDGNTLAVGADAANAVGTDSGAAYVFTRTGTAWSQQAKLLATDADASEQFGYSIAISGETIVVGAPLDDDAGPDSGSAYLFTRTGTTWSQQAKLVAADAATGDDFGRSVEIDGDTVVVGSPLDDDAGTDSGSAYVFTRTGSAWSQQAKLVAADGGSGDWFGHSASVQAGTAVLGAPFDDDTGGTDSGSAYVFTRTGSAWSQQAKLAAGDATTGSGFGISVDVEAAAVIVGAYTEGVADIQSGSAYLFNRVGSTWSQLTKLTAADAAAGDQFGSSVAASQGNYVVGASLDDDAGTNSGSAYVFTH